MLISCPFNLDRPANRVLWEITNRCNMKCKHCLYFSNHDKPLVPDVSTDDAVRIIKQMEKDGTVDEVWLSGGEPLMRSDIFRVISEITKSGMKPSVSTNGFFVNELSAQHLKDCGVQYVHLSIDGMNEKSHDEFRQTVGSFQRAIAAADILSDLDVIVGATCVITWSNIADISKIIELAINHQIKILSFYMVEPLGRGKNLNRELDIQLMKKLSDSFECAKLQYEDRIHLELFRACSSKNEILKSCKCYNFFTITNDGKLGGCPWLMKSGNYTYESDLKQNDFTKARLLVQEGLRLFTKNREQSMVQCRDCSLAHSCGKGCPAVSGIDLIDPICNFLRASNG